MKRLMSIVLFLIFAVNFLVLAETPDYDSLIDRAQGRKVAGITMTFVGLGCEIIAVGVYAAWIIRISSDSMNNPGIIDNSFSSLYPGYYLTFCVLAIAGSVLEGVGIPFWIVGGIQKMVYTRRKNRSQHDGLSSSASVTIRPVFDIDPFKNQPVTLGLQFSM